MPTYTDTELLDHLQAMLDKGAYTGKCILRESETGRGFRLHETSRKNAHPSVRTAIAQHLRRQG